MKPNSYTRIPALMSAATLSDEERRDLLAVAINTRFGNDVMLRCVHSDSSPATVEFSQYTRDADGYRNWDNPQLKQCAFAIADDLTVTLGEPISVIAQTVYTPIIVATLSLSESGSPFADGDCMIYPSARLLSIGDLRDKGFPKPITTQDLQTLIDSFPLTTGVPVNIEHESPALGTADGTATLLSGKMGRVRRVYLSDNGHWVRGEVAIPMWLDAALTDAEPTARQLSVEVMPHSMELIGLALTKTPRVNGAALLSAMSSKIIKGTEPMKVTLSEEQEVSLLDKLVAKMSAFFRPTDDESKVDFAKQKSSKDDKTNPAEPVNMDFASMARPAPQSSSDAVVALSAQVAQLQHEKHQSEAAAFSDKLVREGRALPAEKDSLVSLYLRAAKDDAALPITLNDEPSRLASFKSAMEARPRFAEHLTTERLPSDRKYTVLSTDMVDDETDEEKEAAMKKRKSNLMSRTPLGQKTMTRTKG